MRAGLFLIVVLGCSSEPDPAGTTGASTGGTGGTTSGTGGTGAGGASGGTGGEASCFDYSAFDATTPVVTWEQVAPLFQASCGISNVCHSATSLPAQGYLGNDGARLAL